MGHPFLRQPAGVSNLDLAQPQMQVNNGLEEGPLWSYCPSVEESLDNRLQNKKGGRSRLSFGASFCLLAERAHFPIWNTAPYYIKKEL